MIAVREELPGDAAAVRDVNRQAFGQDREADIVDALRANGAALLSLVATLNGRVVGHIMYSPLVADGDVNGAALGPMAVLPASQRHGIGSMLVEAGSEKLRHTGCPFVVVVGHSAFYPRFGFRPASRHGMACEWNVPDDVFMVLVLDQAKMSGVSGLVKYRPEFSVAGR